MADIDVDRLAAGFNPDATPWTNPAIVAGKDITIRALHFTEMRSRIQDLWTAAGIGSVPEFSAGPVVAQTRLISLRDPTDLRGWLTSNPTNYEGSSWAGQNGRKARAAYRYDNYSDGQSRGYPKGQRTEMWDVSGRTRWTYDARGRIIKEEKWIDGQLYVTEWGYDAMDRVVWMKYPDEEYVTYGYNAQLLLQSMSGSVVGAIASDIAYNPLDLPTAVKLPNAVSDLYLRYRYYALDYGVYPYGALWDIRLQRGSDLLRLEHGYDNVRNVTRVIDSASGDFTYEYDALDRLLKRKITGGADQETFEYDNVPGRSDGKIGNIVRKNNQTYTYGSKPHAVTNDSSQNYGYDANGNMTQRGSGQYMKYDAENRPVKVSSDAGGAQYVARLAYDGDGRRVKRVDNYGTIHYVGPHYERNVGTGADTTEVVTKLYWAQLGPYRRLIAVSRAGLLYYVHGDRLGGTNILSDVYGNEAGAVRYHPFGQTRVRSGLALTDKRFTGQTLDTSIGPSTALAIPTLILTPGSSG